MGDYVSRRGLLKSTMAAAAAGAFHAGMPDAIAAERAVPCGRSHPHPTPQLPFSAAERDRRWAAIRKIMAQPEWNLDAIVAGTNFDGVIATPYFAGYVQYLTQVEGIDDLSALGPVVFPRDASLPVYQYLDDVTAPDFWNKRGLHRWTADGKLKLIGGRTRGDLTAQLKDLKAKRVGVAELEGTMFNSMGMVGCPYIHALQAQLPEVEFVPIERWKINPPGPGPLAASAMIKGPEEQSVIRECVLAGELAIEAILQAARSGATEQAHLWYPAYFAMFHATGEVPTRLSIAQDVTSNSTYGAPTGDALLEGQIINQETSARVQGYHAQVNQAIFIGDENTRGYEYYEAGARLAVETIDAAIEFIGNNRGATIGALIAYCSDRAKRKGSTTLRGRTVHTDGIRNLSRPRTGPRQLGTGEDDNLIIAPGMAFDFKPTVTMRREVVRDVRPENRPVEMGANLLVTESGVIRLGRRDLVPLTTR